MKKSLADKIAEYIKVLIEKSGEDQIMIQRIELAETFCCVPSQVSYVISTRFTEEAGYHTESRKGGNGFVRITRFRSELEQEFFCNKERLMMYIDELKESGKLKIDEHHQFLCLVDQATSKLNEKAAQSLCGALWKVIQIYADDV